MATIEAAEGVRIVHDHDACLDARARDVREKDEQFSEWLMLRQGALLRTAWALTGNPHDAADLVQTAAAKLYLNWEALRDHGAIDAWVRRVMVNENTSLWRRAFKRREQSTGALPETAVADSPTTGPERRCGRMSTHCHHGNVPSWCSATTSS